MSVSMCKSTVDPSGRETAKHGSPLFPVACYYDDLSRDEVPWHWHEELEAVVIAKGCARIAIGNQKFTVHPGEGFFVNSSVLHGAWDLASSGCRFHSLVFHPGFIGGQSGSVLFLNYVQPLIENHHMEGLFLSPSKAWQKEVLHAIERAWTACAEEPVGYEFRVRDALSEVVFLLQHHACQEEEVPGGKMLRDEERMKKMLGYIHEHFEDDLTTDQIAQSASISESECLRCFRSVIGMPPIRYVRSYRIQRASQWLTSTTEKISVIASKCGFQDMSYFTKTFREMKGCTPTEFRKNHRQTERGAEKDAAG